MTPEELRHWLITLRGIIINEAPDHVAAFEALTIEERAALSFYASWLVIERLKTSMGSARFDEMLRAKERTH